MKYALIQTFYEQTLPCILPILALEPAEVTLLHSAQSQIDTEYFEKILAKVGINTKIHSEVFSIFPEILEVGSATQNCIKNYRARGIMPVLNFTSGTKPAAIGAFAAANKEKIPSFYFDSRENKILDAGTGELPLIFRDYFEFEQKIKKRLTVELVANACGIEFISAGVDAKPFLPFANYLKENSKERGILQNYISQKLDPTEPNSVAEFLHTPIQEDVINEDITKYAAQAEIFEKISGKWHFTRPESLQFLEHFLMNENYDRKEWYLALTPFQRNLNFISGGWWEVSVFDAAQRSGKFNDLRWSVQIQIGSGTYEKDIVGLLDCNLALFSCKTGGQNTRLLGALNELDSDARQLGGLFAKKIFCIAKSISKNQIESLQKAAKETKTFLLGPAKRLSPNSFNII